MLPQDNEERKSAVDNSINHSPMVVIEKSAVIVPTNIEKDKVNSKSPIRPGEGDHFELVPSKCITEHIVAPSGPDPQIESEIPIESP